MSVINTHNCSSFKANGELSGLLKVSDVSKRLTIAKSTVYSLIDSGVLECVRVGRGRTIRIMPEAIEQYIVDNTQPIQAMSTVPTITAKRYGTAIHKGLICHL